MATGLESILTHKLNIALRGAITPRVLSQIVGNTVKNLHDGMVSRGEAPAVYQRIVNGQSGAPETSIDLELYAKPRGVIEYRAAPGGGLAEAAIFALREAEQASPHLSGAYASAWVVIVDDREVTDPEQIPPDAQKVIITNYAPYSERLEQTFGLAGGHWTSRSRRRVRGGHPRYMVTLQVASETQAQFSGVRVRREFITLSAVASRGRWPVPYVRQRPPGGAILYPAVIIERRLD